MKKILFLGNNTHVDELIKYAKMRNVYTIVTDNLNAEKSIVKDMADEAWDISIMDYDLLEEAIRKNDINAVLCGASEVCLEATREMCKRVGFRFYSSERTWDIVNDKLKFKKECENVGIPVPRNYKLSIEFNEEDIAKIEFPVVVKPADGCSSIGLHICNNKDELIEGYKDAYDKSQIKKVVVEEFIKGEQVGLVYIFQKGVPILIASGDDVASYEDSSKRVLGFAPSKHIRQFEKEIKASVLRLFTNLDCKHGVAALQFIADGNRLVCLEMNYRLPGGKFNAENIICNNLLDYVLDENTQHIDKDIEMSPLVAYAVWLKPGKIAYINGIDVLKETMPELSVQQIKYVNDEIVDGSGMQQIFGFFLMASDAERGIKNIDIINKILDIRSETGEDMVIRYYYDESGYAKRDS